MAQARVRGFTLIEVLVVVAISAALVLALTLLLRTTGRAALALQTNQGDWSAEQFLRAQARDMAMHNSASGLFEGRSDSLLFVSNRSAAAGHDGAPVVVRYRYDAERHRIEYQERPVSPWWMDAPRQVPILITREFDAGDPEPAPLLVGVDAVLFTYRGIGQEARWLERWDQPGVLPSLVRLQFRRGQQAVEFVLEAGPRVSAPMAGGV